MYTSINSIQLLTFNYASWLWTKKQRGATRFSFFFHIAMGSEKDFYDDDYDDGSDLSSVDGDDEATFRGLLDLNGVIVAAVGFLSTISSSSWVGKDEEGDKEEIKEKVKFSFFFQECFLILKITFLNQFKEK